MPAMSRPNRPPSAVSLEARAETLAGPLPALLVDAERVAATVAQGLHGRRRAGVGETFWQYRRYEPGDRPQSIDWRRTARADPVYVRELEWEAAQTVWLWVDGSASMAYAGTPGGPTKGDRAALLALSLAVLLERAGERFALLDGDPHRSRPPSGGPIGLRRLAGALEQTPGDGGPPPLATVPRHGHVVLFGDFLAPLPETEAVLRALVGRAASGIMVQVLDPVEETFPLRGRVRLRGLEGEGDLVLDRAETLREAYLDRLADHRAGLAALARSADWRLLTHHTDQAAAVPLLALYQALAGAHGGATW